MRKLLMVALMLAVVVPLCSQAPSGKWTVGTVMASKPHLPAGDDGLLRWDITVRIDKTDYVVLYVQRPGASDVEYAEGRDAPVLLGSKTISFRDKMGRKADLPILSKKPAGSQPNVR